MFEKRVDETDDYSNLPSLLPPYKVSAKLYGTWVDEQLMYLE
jgi:hypothetical protein